MMFDFTSPATAISLGIICFILYLPTIFSWLYVEISNFIKYTILRKERPKHHSFIPTNYAPRLDDMFKRQLLKKEKENN